MRVVACLVLVRRHVADGLEEPPRVEPVHPFERVGERRPRSSDKW
jgi:hypothetical protein